MTTTVTIEDVLKKYWGYDSYRSLQKRAMDCVLQGRDSIVVLPTGGGKSLCFQAPAMAMTGMAVVVSPLISLMKDQVDALTECGVPAARLDSALSYREREDVFYRIDRKTLKLLYLSPERLFSNGFIDFLKTIELAFIAVDEAHCVSMWGHDFRPEYRQLGALKKALPDIAIHAYTATATQHVRDDIATQLNLKNHEILVGLFDRPNLFYKTERRSKILSQVREILDRHKNESGIIYCIRRADVDSLCADLSAKGYNVLPYHAGMSDDLRKTNQEAFISEKTDTIVATIAFGMGIDKSNVRYVIHTGMPKSIEHYQQESGRAGRDGLEAECCLFYSGGDYGTWQTIMKDLNPEARNIAKSKLNDIFDYCTGVTCRHKALVNYFGQDFEKDDCSACDVCLGDLELHENSLETAQKIISCVKRLGERFGGEYTAMVLLGSNDKRILENGHDSLSTYGLLSDYSIPVVRKWIDQLTAQGYLEKTGDFNVLSVSQWGWRVIRGEITPRLLKPAAKKEKKAKITQKSWEGVDRNLFDELRELRRKIADERHIPAYVVFSDAALRDMAMKRPSTLETFLQVSGVGETKKNTYGKTFLKAIRDYCSRHSLKMDVGFDSEPGERFPSRARTYEPWTTEEEQRLLKMLEEGKLPREIAEVLERKSSAIKSRIKKLKNTLENDLPKARKPSVSKSSISQIKSSNAKIVAFNLFSQGMALSVVAKTIERSMSTTVNYLVEYIQEKKIDDPSPWLNPEVFRRITEAARETGGDLLKPIYEALNGEISYEEIRIAMACLRKTGE